MRQHLLKAKDFFHRYERHLTSAAFAIGFVIDVLTFANVNLTIIILIFAIHLVIAGGSMFIIHLIESRPLQGLLVERLRSFSLVASYFSFGALASGFFTFYSLSGPIVTSWPFLIFAFTFFAGNEWLTSYRSRLAFQMSIFFFALFSFSILVTPLILRSIGPMVFILSGLASLVVFFLFLALFWLIGPKRFHESKMSIIQSATTIFLLVIIFYFGQVIPPVPLSLKAIGVYHSVTRTGDTYLLSGELHPWYQELFSPTTAHILPGEPVYVFSSVFTPVAITTDIVHRWERYDNDTNAWVASTVVRFPVFGGRDGGYRGYSFKKDLTPGRWRVDVETPGGLLIGRVNFTVVSASVSVPLQEKALY